MELGRVRERRKFQDEMRALALNVFLQSRRLLSHNTTVRSLTGFGTAAAADLFLKTKDVRLPQLSLLINLAPVSPRLATRAKSVKNAPLTC